MATRTVAKLFDNYNDAAAVVAELEAAGFMRDDVSLIANRGDSAGSSTAGTTNDDATGTGAGTGATVGAVLGGGAGLLAGLGALAIPGIGPVVAAGWLVAALAGAGVGAASGGLMGSLVGSGVSEEHAHVYAEGVRRGGNLVTLRTDESRVAQAEGIMARHNPVDATQRGGEYRSAGWNSYDEKAGPWTGGSAAGAGKTSGSLAGGGMAAGALAGAGQADGTPGNPPGTAATRTLGTSRDPV